MKLIREEIEKVEVVTESVNGKRPCLFKDPFYRPKKKIEITEFIVDL